MVKLRRRRDEDGATTMLVAVLALVMLGAGALAVDVGHVYAKRSALQSNVDHAVMAAAAELDNDGACNQEVIDVATEYLLKPGNEVADQIAVNLAGAPGDDDGFIQCNDWKVQLWAPKSHVEYGLAKAVLDEGSPTGVDVPAYAAAAFKSPSQSSSLPMYAVSGCDYGVQQISDPPPGPPPAPTPPALTPDGTAEVRNLVVTPSEAPDGSVAPFLATVTGQVRGLALGTTGQVAFSDPAGNPPVLAGLPALLPTGSGWNNFTIVLPTVPQQVLDGNGIWWVRIKVVRGATEDFSPTAEAEPFTVGDLMFCNGTVSGNFGTLRIARNDSVSAEWLERNMIKGLQPLMQTYPDPTATTCSPADSEHTAVSPTDCLSTDPGFPNEAATDGLVNGSGGDPGRLDQDTTPGCSRNGDSARTGVTPAGESLNDDLLTCFIVGDHSVADVVAGEPGILSADIFKSPRFFQIPVIPVEAANGASGEYPIIGFRTGFITDQALTATPSAPGSIVGWNGVYFHSNHVERLDVVLFDEAALPETAPPVGGEIDYTGSGVKVLVLVE